VSYLLDTNTWKALAQGERLKQGAEVLANPETALYLLDISLSTAIADERLIYSQVAGLSGAELLTLN
jgi:hypothetical protein